MGMTQEVKKLATVDLFTEAKKREFFIGRPYYLDYDKAYLLVADAWKEKVGGIPHGTFVLAFYENTNDDVDECLLLRVLRPAKLPTDNDILSSMVEYYKDNLKTSGKENQLDDVTKYLFSFSGLECRIIGTFFHDNDGAIQLGADVENYFSAHNYAAYKPIGNVLEYIVNFRDGEIAIGSETDYKIGMVRYSSSTRFQQQNPQVPVYVNPSDFLGKRTALFGMTRTGKSNTVKKIIEATTKISMEVKQDCASKISEKPEANLEQFDDSGIPKHKIGQIVFDMNGEYANANLQDEGTAIFEKFENLTTRYSVVDKPGFQVLKVNFYEELEIGFEIISRFLEEQTGDYIKSFLSISLEKPSSADHSAYTRWERKVSIYKCCLKAAGFKQPQNHKVKFQGNEGIKEKIKEKSGREINPSKGISLDDALTFWEWVAENQTDDIFTDYKRDKGHDWLDEEMRALLVLLTRKRNLTGNPNIGGFRKLIPLKDHHTVQSKVAFEKEIVELLRQGKIVIVDLSQGDPKLQQTFANRICTRFFHDSLDRFVGIVPNNFVQFYFEEAHNLFPKKEDRDLSDIYNRIAKEGAKLNIGLIYATQEVSSISSNILKNTQNWFIAHLNNEDELKEIRKFYDFGDFCESLIRYSSGSDKGFIRMKTYSNAFAVPVQIDKFTTEKESS